MKKSVLITFALTCLLGLGLFLVAPGTSEASCTGICEYDFSGGHLCGTCVDAGYETGGLCQQQSQCFCIELQCASSLQSSADSFVTPQDALADELFVDRRVAMTPAEGSCSLEEILFGLPTNG
ncbi:MAG: hypothetical protein PVG07_13065 [Acidobacteriota bacterium]|jgi:hypothetical protein